MRVHWLQHAAHEDLGCIAPWLAQRGHSVTSTALHAGAALPAVDAFDWLIVMGGPMNVDEHAAHPWLLPEKALIRAAIDAGRRVLGICLGAQLIARVLGAAVSRNAEPEIGWFEVQLKAQARGSPLFAAWPDRFTAFHWHGDSFAIPQGARNLMTSAACAHQAFAYGDRVCALQFHLEVTAADARAWLAEEAPTPAPFVQSAQAILEGLDHFAENNRLMLELLQRMEAALPPPA